jgi:hypothetical protein
MFQAIGFAWLGFRYFTGRNALFMFRSRSLTVPRSCSRLKRHRLAWVSVFHRLLMCQAIGICLRLRLAWGSVFHRMLHTVHSIGFARM